MPYLTHQKFPMPLDRDQVTQDWRQRGREWNDFVHATNETDPLQSAPLPPPS